MGRPPSTEAYAFLLFTALALVKPPFIPARHKHGNDVPQAEASNLSSPTVGPARGWLVIDGGGLPQEARRRFVALAGGPNAKFVCIPTARSEAQIGDLEKVGPAFLREFSVAQVVVLHTRDRVRANSSGFVEPLRNASAVWIDGGRQWRLADAYLNTAVEREIKALLARGGVVGGSSAGATIQGSYLVRGASGTPENPDGDNRIMMAPGHETGFGLLAESAIDQHVNVRGREKDLDSVISAHPNLLGIGIDQGAAIVVHGDLFKVVGGQVVIHDGKDHDGAFYYFLSPEQTFNLRTRAVEHGGAESLARNIPAPAAATGESQTNKYPVVLTVTSAQRTNHGGYTTTEIIGYLSDDPRQTQLHMVCDAGIFSRGSDGKPNTYPARYSGKSHQIKVGAREIGSDKVHELTCKY
jgi:cyanophycinase